MLRRHKTGWYGMLRWSITGAVLLTCAAFTLPAQAALLPEGFFDRVPEPGKGQAAIEADYLSQDAAGVVTATGQVDMVYQGYFATADKVVYDQVSQDVTLIGNVIIRDPEGTEYSADRIDVTGNFKKAILQSMVMVTTDGAMVTSTSTDHDDDDVTILENGTYAPCGTCVDSKGRRIGWRVRTERMIYDQDNELIDMHQPIMEILGFPIAWLPWVRLPDPSNPRANGFRLPSYAFSEKIGLKLEFPYFYAAGQDTDLTVTPILMSRQGGLLSATATHRFSDWGGEVSVTASGLYQLDRSAFTGTVGDSDWRGALQASTRFTPTDEWTFGASYSVLSDRAYLGDYLLPTRASSVNEVYAVYLTPQSFADIRLQEFVVLGNATQADQNKQAMALPRARVAHSYDLGADNGQVNVTADLLYARRISDSTTTANGVPFVLGYSENKTHGALEASWTKQWVTDGGTLFTPYLGLRGDYATYDGASALMPGAQQLFTATPIAAIDMRYPFVAIAEGSSHIVEPIAQLVYRASNTTSVGVTNDNAQSFAFDDTNLFSFNRFSGTDRQETGLRANVGAHYLANFDDGSYLDFIAGQSFHLGGVNALGISDSAQTGTSSGLGSTSSYIVAGLKGAVNQHLTFGAKAQFDPSKGSITRTAVAASFQHSGWQLGVDYAFAIADPLLGAPTDQQDIGGSIRVPIHDYWYANAAAGYNITASQLLDRSASITYDDGYFAITGSYGADGPDPFNPTTQTYKVTFQLKGPDGTGYGFGG